MDPDTLQSVAPVIDTNHTFCTYNITMTATKLTGPVSSAQTIFSQR